MTNSKGNAMDTGFFGEYGGQFISEPLKKRLDALAEAFRDAMADKGFQEEYLELLRDYVGRPSALTHQTQTIVRRRCHQLSMFPNIQSQDWGFAF